MSTTTPAPDVDTAIVLGMASTALPFADSAEAEAERWLRILRMHGRAGAALQALGVSEAPLEAAEAELVESEPPDQSGREDMVRTVTEQAVHVAVEREAKLVSAGDVLVAVMHVYGSDFDHVLQAHGTDREEVLERLASEPPAIEPPASSAR
ncbi:MAG TPA: hypothetical protein VKG82_05335 [Solirubrobacteraceae bacterium]|nr:hypothetical protein [Solirubrobacteraceae bacterium]